MTKNPLHTQTEKEAKAREKRIKKIFRLSERQSRISEAVQKLVGDPDLSIDESIDELFRHSTSMLLNRVNICMQFYGEKHLPEAEWLNQLVSDGVTPELVSSINEALEETITTPMLAENPPILIYTLKKMGSSEEGLQRDRRPYDFARTLAEGGFDGLKICALDDCKNFFASNPKGKWCSNTCGSKYRQRKRRDSRRKGQML